MPQTGTAWVPVYPDTRRVTPETARAFSRLGPYAVEVTPQVRDMASVRRALAAIPSIVVPVDIDDRQLADLRAKLQSLGNHTIGVDISAGQVRQELAAIGAQLDRLSGQTARIEVAVDAGAASAALQGAESEVRRLDGRTSRVQVVADVATAVASIASVFIAANQLDGRVATIQVAADTARALVGMTMVAARASALGGAVGGVAALGSVVLGLGPAGAIAAGGLGAAVLASGGVGKALTALGAAQDAAGQDAQASAQKQAQSARQVEAAQTRLSETTAKAGQARSDSARNVERAEAEAAAGIATARERVASAAKSLQSAEASASKARRDFARSVSDAEQQSSRSIASARQSAARAIVSAEQAAAAAHDRLGRATTELATRQWEMNRAWEEGRRSLEDLQDQVDGNALDQRQAAFDLADARKALAEAQATGDNDQIARAQLGLDRQLETMDRLSKQTQRLGVDNAEAQSRGIDGSDAAVAAQEREFAAREQVRDAAKAAGQADFDLVQARRDGAASVAQAEADGAERIARAREQGAESVAAADARVSDARLQLRAAEAGVEEARVKGAERVADAQEQGARSIAAADAAVLDAQRALQDALVATGSEASATQQALQTAFANLSPAAASFALYLWSLKGLFDELRATAAAGFFPPVQAGLQALVGQFSVFRTVVGQFAAAMGGALGYVLTQLASPFWASFFSVLGVVAGPIMMQLAVVLMGVAQAAAGLILALLPFAPMALDMLALVGQLIGVWTPFIALLVGQLLPVAGMLLTALMPLGPVLGALSPILAVLGQMFAMVLGALLQALVPVIVALTPLIQHLALAWGQQLVGAIVAITPLLVAVATWMSQHPQLVLGLVTVLGTLFASWQLITTIVGTLLGPLFFLRIAMNALGLSATAILAPFGAAGAAIAGWLGRLAGGTGVVGLLRLGLTLLGQAVTWLLRTILAAIGPLGWIAIILGVLYTQNEAFRGAVNGLLGVLLGLVGVIISSLAPVLDVLVQVMNILGGVFAGVAGGLATALVPVVQALADVLAWLTPVIVPLVQVFLAVRTAMMLWAAAQWALNLAMAANPIGLVVLAVAALVGALVWAWQSSETFRNIVTTAWNAITAAVSWAWNAIIWPVLSAIGQALAFLGAIIFTILVAPFLIAWNLISAAVGFAWNNIILPIWTALVWFAQNVIAPVAMWLYTNIMKPIWDAIGAAISFVWNNIILPVWTALVWYVNNVTIPVMQFLYYNIIKPIWDAIGAAISFVWNNIILPVWNAIVFVINTILIPAVQFLYYNVIKPIWDAIGAAINFVWTNVIRPAFDAIWGGLQWLGDRFSDAVGNIQRIWDGIRGILARPINFMIDVVWNNGILKAWNAVAGLVGIPAAMPLARIQEFAEGGMSEDHRATITSPGAPIRVWSEPETGGEAYIPMANSKRPRSTAILDSVADRFGYGLVPRNLALFADGGLWRQLAAAAPAGSRLSSWYRSGDPGYHGQGKAVDLVGNLGAINQEIAQRYPNSTQLIYTPGVNLFRGRPHTYNAATRADHFDHVHWAMENAAMLDGRTPGGGASGGIGSVISSFFKDRARSAFDTITNPALDAIRGLMGTPPPAWREVVPALATKMRDTVRDFVFRKADEKDAAASAGGNGAAMGPPTAGQIAHAREIGMAAKERGIGRDGFVIALMTALQESGIRILANRSVPGSLALPHEGIGGDHDSVGIFQQRQAGWGTLPMRMNARASAGMFFNKLGRGPFGDYGAAAQRVQVSAFPGAYSKWRAKAEEIAGAAGFDDGGWALGKGVMLKDVITPERVLDPVESQAGYRPLVRLAGQLGAGQVQVSTREAATARAAAEAAKSDSNGTAGGPAVAHFYDTDGVLIGTIRGEVDSGMAAVAGALNDGSS